MVDIDSLLNDTFLKKFSHISIIKLSENIYGLFNVYIIEKTADKLYNVSIYGKHTEHNFYNIRNAFAWCVFDKRNKIVESQRILSLDKKLQGLESNMELHRHLIKTSKNEEQRFIYFSKLTDEKVKRSEIAHELNGYINESKTYQERRFAENNL
jgi:hypothetical protein